MLELYTYRIPFKQPFSTGSGTYKFREGVLIRFHNMHIDVVSEVAPLPGFSRETLKESIANLLSKKTEHDSFFSRPFTLTDLDIWVQSQAATPSVEFGLSSLGLCILSARKQSPIHKLLKMKHSTSLKVNAVIGSTDESSFRCAAEDSISRGFNILKCKVTPVTGHLPKSIRLLVDNHPSVTFRLDANRSWKRNKLKELSSLFKGLPVEYIEEPCSIDSIHDFNAVIQQCELPVAADETLSDFGMNAVIEHTDKTPYLIIKPTLHGNLMQLFATLRSRNHLEDRVIFTTALESAVGTRMIASAAAMAGSKTAAHGLNTGSLFHQNLADEDSVKDGTFQLQTNFKSWYSFQSINQSLVRPVP